MLGFLKDLVTPAKPTDPQILHCDPLVVEHPTDGIVYCHNTDVDFLPDPNDVRVGRVTARVAQDGWLPDLTIQHRVDMPVNGDPRFRDRGGATLFGIDAEGYEFTWYIGTAADQALIDKDRCDISYPCLPDISPEDLQRLKADKIDDGAFELWDCEPLVIVDDENEVAFEGKASIEYVRVKSAIQDSFLKANFVTEDGWLPTLHAVVVQQRTAKDGSFHASFRGYDEEGLPFTWLIGKPALDELVRREDHRIGNEPE